jgi:hypothetical protein
MKTTHTKNLLAAALVGALLAPFSHAQAQTADPAYKFEAGYPTHETSQRLYDEMDYQRAVQAYIWAVPLVNAVAFSKALTDAGVSPVEPSLLVFDRPLTPKQIIMTANSEVIYVFTVVDLSKTGPVVIDVPAGILGSIVDAWQRAIEDIGVGPSLNGGKFLLLPPGYKGDVPDGYIVVRCRTNLVFPYGRGILKPGDSTEPFVKLVSSIKLYPLAQKDAPKPTRIVLNGNRPFDSDWPKDARYFDYMAKGISSEVVQPEDKLMLGMLKPLGIEPGKPFNPDDRTRRILAKAAGTGAAMMANMAFENRFEGRQSWQDRQWEKIAFVSNADFETVKSVEVDERAAGWYQLVMSARYGFGAKPVPGQGSFYLSTFKDGQGEFLDGSKRYKITVQANQPAKNFWSITAYDNRTRSMIDTDQQRAGLSSFSKFSKNADGSVDLFFGPAAPAGKESNWIKTIPGQGFFTMFRLYGPLEPVFDGTWKLNDIEKVK